MQTTSRSEARATAAIGHVGPSRPAANDDRLAIDPPLVWSHLGAGPNAPAWLVCPAPGLVALAAPGQYRAHCVLLHSPEGRIWMFELNRGYGSRQALAEVLIEIAAKLAGSSMPEAAMQHALDGTALPLRFVVEPVLHPIHAGEWQTRRLAMTLALWDKPRRWVIDAASQVHAVLDEWQQRIHGELADALECLAVRLEPRGMRLAMRGGVLDISLYNYLALRPHQRYRQQFALTFPLLLDAAAHASNGSPAQRLVELVDEGKPLVKGLALAVGVSLGAVRSLLHRGPDVVGQRWEERPWDLLQLLDTLTPENRPAADPNDWRKLEKAAATAREVFRTEPWQSPLASTWLRRCARDGWRALDRLEPAPHLARMLDDSLGYLFFAALCEAVQHAVAVPDDFDASAAQAIAMAAVVTQLARLPAELRDRMAIGFGGRLMAGFCVKPGSTQAAQWQALPALLPHDIASPCGLRVIRAVDSSALLSRHGLALKNCLFGRGSARHALVCAMGDSFVVAVCDAFTGDVLSLADFRPEVSGDSTIVTLRLVQHRAARNATPTGECIHAVARLNSQIQDGCFDEHLSAVIDRTARHGCRSRALHRALRAGALRRDVLAVVDGTFFAALIDEFKAQWAASPRPLAAARTSRGWPIGLEPAADRGHAP